MVICCGTTLGKIDALKKYSKYMLYIISTYNIKDNVEQAIHNYIFYLNKLDLKNIKLLSNDDNFVNTLGFDIHRINKDNLFINSKNEVSYIVHQYDRCTTILKKCISDTYDFTL